MKKFLILALLLSLPTLALAMPSMGDKAKEGGAKVLTAEEKFNNMDTNKDKQVDMSEFTSAYPQMNDAVFGIIDADKSKFITFEEWMDFQATHMQGVKKEDIKDAMPKNNNNLMIMPPKTKE